MEVTRICQKGQSYGVVILPPSLPVCCLTLQHLGNGWRTEKPFSSYSCFLRTRMECFSLSRIQGGLASVSHKSEKLHSQNFLFQIGRGDLRSFLVGELVSGGGSVVRGGSATCESRVDVNPSAQSGTTQLYHQVKYWLFYLSTRPNLEWSRRRESQ